MALAIFDLDNTLLAGDSDYLWGKFLVDQGEVDGDYYEQTNLDFYEDYKAGRLDIFAYQKFSLEPLTRLDPAYLQQLHERYMAQVIQPLITQAALDLVAKHRQQQDTLMIITATNSFITAPIAKSFGIEYLLATDPEIIDGRYTGNIDGTPCYQQGKVTRLQAWLQQHNCDLNNSWFYSDSHNDLPLLKMVAHPIAVNPDNSLREYANAHNWPIMNLHDEVAKR